MSRLGGIVRRLLEPGPRRAILALVDQASVSGASFLTTILVGRFAGQEELGIYALGVTMVLLVASAQDSLVSVPYTFFRERVGEATAAEYRGSVLAHHLTISTIVVVGLASFSMGLIWGIGPKWMIPVTWILAAALPAVLLREFARRFAFSHEQMGTALLIDAGVAVSQLGGILALGLGGRLTAVSAFSAVAIANGVAGVTWLAYRRQSFLVRPDEIRPAFGRHWGFARWDLSAQLVGVVQGYVVYWLLALRQDAGDTGAFAACMTVVMISNPLILGVNNVFMPRVAAAMAAGGAAAVWREVRRTTLLVGIGMAILTVPLVVFGGPIVRLVYGPEFAGVGFVVALLAVAVAAGATEITAANGLRALERPDVYFGSAVAALVVTAAAAWPLVGGGVEGAAWAVLAGALVEPAIQWFRLVRLVHAPAPG